MEHLVCAGKHATLGRRLAYCVVASLSSSLDGQEGSSR
jgi:hypothetical protein